MVHSVSAHIMGSQYYVLYLDWWWLNEPKHVAEFLKFITNICCVYWLNKLLYYCNTQRDVSYQNLEDLTMRTSVLRFSSLQTASYLTGSLGLKTKAPSFFRNVDNWLPRNAAKNTAFIPTSKKRRSTTRRHRPLSPLSTAVPQALPTGFGQSSTSLSLHREPAAAATSRDSCDAQGHDKW